MQRGIFDDEERLVGELEGTLNQPLLGRTGGASLYKVKYTSKSRRNFQRLLEAEDGSTSDAGPGRGSKEDAAGLREPGGEDRRPPTEEDPMCPDGDESEIETVFSEEGPEDLVLSMRDLAAAAPERVLRYLEQHGLETLGELEVRDSYVVSALRSAGHAVHKPDAMLTLGTNDRHLDHARLWKNHLRSCGQYKVEGWSAKMTVEAKVVTLQNAAAEGEEGILQPLLQRWKSKAADVSIFGLPAVQAVVQQKWNTFVRSFVLAETILYIIMFGGFLAFTLLIDRTRPVEWTWNALWKTPKGRAAIICEGISLACLPAFLYVEWRSVLMYRWAYLSLWNIIDLGAYIGLVAVAILHFSPTLDTDGHVTNVVTAVEVLLLWLKLQFFFRVFQPMRSTPVDVLKGLVFEMRWFLILMASVLVGFAHAFYVLFRLEDTGSFYDGSSEDFTTFSRSIVTVLAMMLALFDVQTFFRSKTPMAASILFVSFLFLVSVLMLNLLIALMTGSYAKISRREHLKFQCSKAQIVVEVESLIPSFVKRRNAHWWPAYIHVLTVKDSAANNVHVPGVAEGDPAALAALLDRHRLDLDHLVADRLAAFEDTLSKRLDRIEHALGVGRSTSAHLRPRDRDRDLGLSSQLASPSGDGFLRRHQSQGQEAGLGNAYGSGSGSRGPASGAGGGGAAAAPPPPGLPLELSLRIPEASSRSLGGGGLEPSSFSRRSLMNDREAGEREAFGEREVQGLGSPHGHTHASFRASTFPHGGTALDAAYGAPIAADEGEEEAMLSTVLLDRDPGHVIVGGFRVPEMLRDVVEDLLEAREAHEREDEERAHPTPHGHPFLSLHAHSAMTQPLLPRDVSCAAAEDASGGSSEEELEPMTAGRKGKRRGRSRQRGHMLSHAATYTAHGAHARTAAGSSGAALGNGRTSLQLQQPQPPSHGHPGPQLAHASSAKAGSSSGRLSESGRDRPLHPPLGRFSSQQQRGPVPTMSLAAAHADRTLSRSPQNVLSAAPPPEGLGLLPGAEIPLRDLWSRPARVAPSTPSAATAPGAIGISEVQAGAVQGARPRPSAESSGGGDWTLLSPAASPTGAVLDRTDSRRRHGESESEALGLPPPLDAAPRAPAPPSPISVLRPVPGGGLSSHLRAAPPIVSDPRTKPLEGSGGSGPVGFGSSPSARTLWGSLAGNTAGALAQGLQGWVQTASDRLASMAGSGTGAGAGLGLGASAGPGGPVNSKLALQREASMAAQDRSRARDQAQSPPMGPPI